MPFYEKYLLLDIHDNFDNLVKIFQEISDKNIDQLINGGISRVITSHNILVHLVWGNNDSEVVNITTLLLILHTEHNS